MEPATFLKDMARFFGPGPWFGFAFLRDARICTLFVKPSVGLFGTLCRMMFLPSQYPPSCTLRSPILSLNVLMHVLVAFAVHGSLSASAAAGGHNKTAGLIMLC